MVLQGANCLIFGGYNGSSASNTLLQIDLQPVMQLQRSSLQDLINCMACCGSDSSSALVVPGCCDTDSKHRGSGKSDQLLAGAGAGAGDDDAAAATSTVDAGDANSIKLKAVGVVPKAIVLPVVPPVVKALSKKAAPPPLRLSDLPNADEVAAMPQWKQVRQLHQVRVYCLRRRLVIITVTGTGLQHISRGPRVCHMWAVFTQHLQRIYRTAKLSCARL